MSWQSSQERDRRREQIRAGLDAVRERVRAACAAAGRDPGEMTIVAVSKTFPARDVRLAVDLGVRDVGENRDQEARGKAEALADLDLRWHFVGRLQRNKAASVARYASVVHSVDRADLADALARGAERAQRVLCALVQVNLDAGEERAVAAGGAGRRRNAGGSALPGSAGTAGDPPVPSRGGAVPALVPAVADRIAGSPWLRLGGVMAVAPLGADPAPAFAELAGIAARVRSDHPEATIVSAGMTGDLEAAIAAGATLVRVGTAVFGSRPPMLLR